MNVLTSLLNTIKGARRAVDQIADSARKLLEAHTSATAKRDWIQTAPEPSPVVVAAAMRCMDAIHQSLAADAHHSLVRSFSAEIDETGTVIRQPALSPHLVTPNMGMFHLLCLFAPEELKRSLTTIIQAQPYESPGPIAERPALLRAVDAEIRALEEQYEQLHDGAAAGGIQIELPPVIRERREQARIQAEREQASAAHRHALEAAAHQQAAPRRRPRTSESPYLRAANAGRPAPASLPILD